MKINAKIKLISVASTIIILWILNLILLVGKATEVRGSFGDMFGAVNALFSGFAFLGLIYTILLQKEELELTRDEIKKSAKTQKESENLLKIQTLAMNKTAKISSLTASIESLEKRINLLPLSGQTSIVEKNQIQINEYRKKISEINIVLDALVEEILSVDDI